MKTRKQNPKLGAPSATPPVPPLPGSSEEFRQPWLGLLGFHDTAVACQGQLSWYVYTHTSICTYAHTSPVYIYIHINMPIHVRLPHCMYVYTYVDVYMHTYIYTHTHRYICTYSTHIHIYPWQFCVHPGNDIQEGGQHKGPAHLKKKEPNMLDTLMVPGCCLSHRMLPAPPFPWASRHIPVTMYTNMKYYMYMCIYI